MIEFDVKLADLTFHIEVTYPCTRDYCRDYMIEERGEHEIIVTQEDIATTREFCLTHKEQVDENILAYTDRGLERVTLARKVADIMAMHDRILMHGSCIAVDGKAYIFTAVSGTGKSTHTRLLRQLLGDRAFMVNDDKPYLRFEGDKVFVYGAPWMGKHNLGANVKMPLAGIFFLHRSKQNELKQTDGHTMLNFIMEQCHRPTAAEPMLNTLEMFDKLPKLVPFYDFGCNMDISAAELSSSVMK